MKLNQLIKNHNSNPSMDQLVMTPSKSTHVGHLIRNPSCRTHMDQMPGSQNLFSVYPRVNWVRNPIAAVHTGIS
jgi:hypothetical protein